MSLSLRFKLGLVAIVLVIAGSGAWFVVGQARQAVDDEMQSAIDLSSALVRVIVAEVPVGGALAALERIRRVTESTRARHVHVMLRTPGVVLPELPPVKKVPRWFVNLISPEPERLTRSVEVAGANYGIVLRADPADEVEETWREARGVLVMLGLFAAIATALMTWFGRLTLHPLRDISLALMDIDEGRYRMPLGNVGIKEIDAVTSRLNHMASERVQRDRELAELARRALDIREEERKRLAHELHDEMGQSISAIKALAVSISQRDTSTDQRIKRSADTIAEVSTHVYDKVRQLMSQLRPTALDELGLLSALEDMVDDWNSHHENCFCSFSIVGQVPPTSPAVGISIFRIVQEALTNIAKHSGATLAAVTLEHVAARADTAVGELILTIKDNGVGFDATTTRRGLGLVGISERAGALHGKLTLATQPGHGTELKLSCNLQGLFAGAYQDKSPTR